MRFAYGSAGKITTSSRERPLGGYNGRALATRFETAIQAFTQLNAAEPAREDAGGVARPGLLVQAERLAAWIERLEPHPSEALRLAAHCQHLERWKIPRSEFPEGRAGYLQWRTRLARYHAERARAVLAGVGYDDEAIRAVETIVSKQQLRSNPDSQTMEDALCLVFLEYELEDFLGKYPDESKAVDILRKTWKKLSTRAQAAALELELSERGRRLVARALDSSTAALAAAPHTQSSAPGQVRAVRSTAL
jgi:hypothetical protein